MVIITKTNKIQKKTRKIQGGNLDLYSAGKHIPKTITGFSNKKKALLTLKNIKKYPINYQKQVVITMYNRAKYHPYKNAHIQDAMNVFQKWMTKHNIKIKKKTIKQHKYSLTAK